MQCSGTFLLQGGTSMKRNIDLLRAVPVLRDNCTE